MTNPIPTDWRALCAELFAIVEDEYSGTSCLTELRSRTATALDQPEPQGPTLDEEPTDQEIEEWADAAAEVPLEEMDPEVHGWRRCFKSDEFSETIRAALRRWGRPAIEPVSVDERLPTRELDELDYLGTCWMFHPVNYHYCLCVPDPSVHTHWLPHWALPVPQQEAE